VERTPSEVPACIGEGKMTQCNVKNGYPKNWKAISAEIIKRSGGQCECTGECALHRGKRCVEKNGHKAKWANGKIVLTVAHRNHYPPDCRPENLMALCNRCHLRYDTMLHKRNLNQLELL
jgi:5-methylcytosine-specific restriction endonuclease McrA